MLPQHGSWIIEATLILPQILFQNRKQLQICISVHLSVNVNLRLTYFNSGIALSYRSISLHEFYFIVGLRANQRLCPILG